VRTGIFNARGDDGKFGKASAEAAEPSPDADETISLSPPLNLSRPGTRILAEHCLAPLPRNVVKEHTPSHGTERCHPRVIQHASGIVDGEIN